MGDNFGSYFLLNTFLQKINVERDFHLIIFGWTVYNYFPFAKVKEYFLSYTFSEKEIKSKISFEIIKSKDYNTGENDMYLAIIEYIKNLPHIKESCGKQIQLASGNDAFLFEVSQRDSFLIDDSLQIHGRVDRSQKNEDKGFSLIINLIIYSNLLTHQELSDWIINLTKKWKDQKKNYLNNGKIYFFTLFWDDNRVYDYRGKINYNYSEFFSSATFENTFFPGREILIQELERFKNGKEEFEKRGWPHQFGIALTGVKGSGKTRVLKCISNYMKRHLITIDMSKEIPTRLLMSAIRGSFSDIKLKPSEFIIVFEEIVDQSSLFGKREEEDEKMEKEEKEKLEKKRNFISSLLSTIDGPNERRGGMIIMTTNNKERLDSALLRPGRIDFHFHLVEGYDRKTTFQVICDSWREKMGDLNEDDLKDDVVDRYTGAELIKEIRINSWETFKSKFFK